MAKNKSWWGYEMSGIHIQLLVKEYHHEKEISIIYESWRYVSLCANIQSWAYSQQKFVHMCNKTHVSIFTYNKAKLVITQMPITVKYVNNL